MIDEQVAAGPADWRGTPITPARVVTFVENDGRTVEEIFGHPAQYAYVGRILVLNSGHATDAELRNLTGVWGDVERINRCPTCEQWAPCDVRKAR